MRQAGRWDPEFNRIRAGRPFYEFNEDVALSAEVSLAPRRFGVDAIILFYDITTLPVAMGLPFALKPERGPVPDRPVLTTADVERLAAEPHPDSFGHIRALLRTVRDRLGGALPVIAFAGAPFTVATYCIDTGKDLVATRKFAAERPAVWDALMERLTTATVHFLRTMVGEGADVYQLFDSWAGGLDEADYRRWAHAPHRQILSAVTGVPRILFVKEGPYLDLMAESGAEVVSLGVRHDLADARRRWPELAFQGNVSEAVLRDGTPEEVRAATLRCREQGGGRRHIINLSHGCDRRTPVANFEAYIRAARGE
jgi:uroporphyrinogen decarboxylase